MFKKKKIKIKEMKAVKEKAKEYIDNLIDSLSLNINHEESNYDAGQVHALSDYGKEIYKVGFLEGQSNPKIKQLEWEQIDTSYFVDEYNPIGYKARINEWDMPYKQYAVLLGLNSSTGLKIFKTLEEAKAFVQEDFEQRVKECLITE